MNPENGIKCIGLTIAKYVIQTLWLGVLYEVHVLLFFRDTCVSNLFEGTTEKSPDKLWHSYYVKVELKNNLIPDKPASVFEKNVCDL